ncbi:MAG: FtsX-like permease family protein [Clostridiaceae bacterium]|nr:FtsX-like permease family protein [Clostridiaceae bacterium]
MNIVNRLTLRQLKLNKKRTLVTIIGVIISAAMVTAVATLGASFMDLLRRQTIAEDGEWHILYKNVNKEQVQEIKNDLLTKNTILSRDVGYSILEGSQNKNKPYIFVKEYNKDGYQNYPIELKEGRFPEKNNEIAISEAILLNAKVDFKIGDVLSLEIGKRYSLLENYGEMPLGQTYSLIIDENGIQEVLTSEEFKEYTIVGIIKRPSWEPTWSPGYTAVSYINENELSDNDKVNAAVAVKKVSSKIFDYAQDFAEEHGIQTVSFNHELLRYYGAIKNDEAKRVLINFSAIIISIIMIGSVSLIYNAFAISVSERSRNLGMLSSVGATKKQKRNSVFFEGFVIGLISIPIGIISGLLGIGITFYFINPLLKNAFLITEGLKLVVMPSSIIVSVIVSIITILISTYIPARRASNISAIDAIRQTADIKITRRQVKTSWLTRKIFGIEGEIGLKNLKRNKKRYKITVFSIVVSMVLFLSVSFFTDFLEKTMLMTQEGINYDIEVFLNVYDSKEKDEIIDDLSNLNGNNNLVYYNSLYLYSWVDKDLASDQMRSNPIDEKDQMLYYNVYLNAMNDEALRDFANEVGIEFELLKNPENPQAIVIDMVKYRDYVAGKYVETRTLNVKAGDKINIHYNDWEQEKEHDLAQIEIAAYTDKLPMGLSPLGDSAGFRLIVSQDTLDRILTTGQDINFNIETKLYFTSNDSLKLQEIIEEYQNKIGQDKIFVFNVFQFRQREEQMILLMKVFVYGFITLITAICIANIFNTISTSIALRKREFAMLKSVGMTPNSFNKMINYESIFYGIKALFYGLPISFGVMYLLHRSLAGKFSFGLSVPWFDVGITVAAVFIIVGMAMLYSGAKVKKENIIDVLKREII